MSPFRHRIRILAVVLLMAFVTPVHAEEAGQGPGSAALNGLWRGQVTQLGATPYSAILSIDAEPGGAYCGTIDYPELVCGARLICNADGTFREEIAYGAERCVDGGHFRMTGEAHGARQWIWFYPDGQEGARAALTRIVTHQTPPPGKLALAGDAEDDASHARAGVIMVLRPAGDGGWRAVGRFRNAERGGPFELAGEALPCPQGGGSCLRLSGGLIDPTLATGSSEARAQLHLWLNEPWSARPGGRFRITPVPGQSDATPDGSGQAGSGQAGSGQADSGQAGTLALIPFISLPLAENGLTSSGPWTGDAAEEIAAELESLSVWAKRLLGAGHLGGALLAAESALVIDPKYPRGHYLRGDILGEMGRYPEAVAALARFTRHSPQLADGWTDLGWFTILSGQFEQARPLIQRAMALDPEEMANPINLGHVFFLLGDDETARSWYERGAALIPDEATLDWALHDFDLFRDRGWRREAQVAMRAWFEKRWRESRPTITKPGSTPEPDEPGAEVLDQVLEQVYDLFEQERFDEILPLVEAVIAAAPDFQTAHLIRAYLLAELERYDEAIAETRRIIGQDPEDDDAWGILCWSAILDERAEASREACERAVALDPESASWTVNRGHIDFLAGDEEAAGVWYRRAVALIADRAVLEEVLADFDMFVARGWRPEASRGWRVRLERLWEGRRPPGSEFPPTEPGAGTEPDPAPVPDAEPGGDSRTPGPASEGGRSPTVLNRPTSCSTRDASTSGGRRDRGPSPTRNEHGVNP